MENQLYAAIEEYLRKQMPPDERLAFESKMAADPGLASEVAFYEALLLHHDSKIKARWRAEGEAMLGNSLAAHPSPRIRRMQWAAAAALALLLTATGIWYARFYNPYAAIVDEYREPYKYSGNLGAAENGAEDSQWQHALEAYRSEDYREAIGSAGQLLQSPKYADEARLLSGVAWLKRDRPEEAVRAMEGIKTAALREKARFYTALAYLQAKEPDKARAILDSIEANSPYRAKASEILARLPEK